MCLLIGKFADNATVYIIYKTNYSPLQIQQIMWIAYWFHQQCFTSKLNIVDFTSCVHVHRNKSITRRKSKFMWTYFNRNPITCNLRKEKRLIYLFQNHLDSKLILKFESARRETISHSLWKIIKMQINWDQHWRISKIFTAHPACIIKTLFQLFYWIRFSNFITYWT